VDSTLTIESHELHSVNPKEVEDVVKAIEKIEKGGVDYAVECSV
jgi:Zn-dependent alcohol dehydrogenase